MKLYNLFESLDITDQQLKQARGNKHHFLVNIPAKKFIILTTPNDKALDRIMDRCQTVDDYNYYTQSGETLIMPNIVVQGDMIVGHEGRHRAAALLCKDENATITIAMRYKPNGRQEAEKLRDKYGSRYEYTLQFEDVPDRIVGQFGRGVILKDNIEFIRNLQQ